ncbi:MAG TPA: rhamnulose-1-phosphate aldolase [Chloroflexia bacterium]|nr:rhamnulose-1-phosphate aldolase [Chloroflexia bacterium]
MSQVYFPRIIQDIGEAGVQLTGLESTEGSAGNISVFARDLKNLSEEFIRRGEIELPASVPELTDSWIVVTGTGRRLRDVIKQPEQNLVVLHIQPGGEKATWYAAAELKPSSEWNSHLAIHAEHFKRREIEYQAIVHAQPHNLTYLSHHPNYATTVKLNNRLLRWEPETIVTFPEGIGLIPFHVPGSAVQMEDTVKYLKDFRLVVWQKHGVVSRSDTSASKAADLVEYAEMAARYEVLNLQLGSPTAGLTDDELRAVCSEFNVPLPPFLENGVKSNF